MKLWGMRCDRLSSPLLAGQMLHCHADLPARSPTAVTHDSILSISSRAALQCFSFTDDMFEYKAEALDHQ